MTQKPFCIRFSGVTIRFIPSRPVALPDELSSLLTEDSDDVDATYSVRPLESPLAPVSSPVTYFNGTTVYRLNEGWLRIFPLQTAENGAQVACLLCPDNYNTLYYPTELWNHYTTPMHCCHLIGLETLLIQRSAFLLHSSVVTLDGKAVLFAGPSGAGKSTQADLWKKHLNADILNGDRCVITEIDGRFWGGGSPLSGHSRIYRKEQAPIAGIILVEHAQENTITRLGIEALPQLLSQTLINSWDSSFMERIADLYQRLFSTVEIFRLSCKPDIDAVRLVHETLF